MINRFEMIPLSVPNISLYVHGLEIWSERVLNPIHLGIIITIIVRCFFQASVMSDEASLEKTSATLRKGLLWTQRDKLFSRWKERYFVLTRDYLNCFKKGTSRLSEMGEFLYKVKIGEIEDIELLDKRGYLTVCVSTVRDGKIYLRKTEGIRDWHRLIKVCKNASEPFFACVIVKAYFRNAVNCFNVNDLW